MSPREFSYKRTLNRVNADLANWLDQDDWRNSKTILIERTYFAPNHAVGYGLNGNSEMVELQTDLIEAKSIRIERSYFGHRGQALIAYIKTVANTYRGEHLPTFTRLVVSKDGTETAFNIPYRGEFETELTRKLLSTFGELFCKSNRWTRDGYDVRDRETVETSLKGLGFELLALFEFNIDLQIEAKAVKITRNGLSFAVESRGTYNTLPTMITIEKMSKVKGLRLKDLGVETSGYYDHHVNLKIRPEQAKQAKAFARRVAKLKRGA